MQHPDIKPGKKRRLGKTAKALLLVGTLALAAAAVAIGVPKLIEANPGASAPAATAALPFRTLASAERTGLESITVSQKDGDEYTLLYENERLYLLEENGDKTAINEAVGESMLAAVTSLSVEETVAGDAAEVAEHLADMGLEPPQITVTIHRGDGDQWLRLGLPCPETTYYYYRWSGDPGVYLCDNGTYEAFECSRLLLLPVEQPSFTAARVDWVRLQKRGEEAIELAFSVTASDTAVGSLRSPYAYPLRADSAQSLLEGVAGLRLGARAEIVTAQNRAELGMDDPLLVMTVHQAQGYQTEIDGNGQLVLTAQPEVLAQFTVLSEEGEYFYRVEYEGVVYQVSRLLLQAFVEADPDALCTRAPADLGEADVASVQLERGGASLSLVVTRTERVLASNELETDADGNVVYDTAVTVNGAEIALEAYQAFAERLTELTVSGTLSAAFDPAGRTPSWQMTIAATDGQTRTLVAYPLDAFSDALVVDGVALHYLNNEALDALLGPLGELLQ